MILEVKGFTFYSLLNFLFPVEMFVLLKVKRIYSLALFCLYLKDTCPGQKTKCQTHKKSQKYEETLRRCNLEQLCYCSKTKWQSSNEFWDPSAFSCKQSTVLHCQSHCPFVVTEREVWQHRTDSHRPSIHKTCVRISQGFSTQHAIQEFSSIKLPPVISFVTTDESLI